MKVEPTNQPNQQVNPAWSLLPLVSVLAGAWAFPKLPQPDHWFEVAVAATMVLGGWFLFWYALTATDWATPLASWRQWHTPDTVPPLPYLQKETPGAALHHSLSLARGWWRVVGRDALLLPLRLLTISLFVSVLLAAVLGRRALLLSGILLAWAELAVLWHEGKGRCGAGWAGVALVGLPWWLGSSLGNGDVLLPFLTALTLSVLVGFYGGATPVAVLGPLLGAGFLVWRERYLGAGLLLLLAVPGLLLLTSRPQEGAYRRAIVPWVLAMIVLMAVAS